VDNSNEVVLVTRKGRAIRFAVEGLRTASRTSGGVRGIRVVDDQLVSMDAIFPQYYLLTVTEKGYGKVSAADHYPKHGRGGKGIQTHKVNEKTGLIAAARMVAKDEKDLILSSKEGKVVRIPIAEISAKGRRTMGLRVMSLNEGDVVVAITTQSVKSQQSLL